MKRYTAGGAILLILVALVGWRWSGDEAGYPIVNEQPTGKAIIALGDSLTAGVGAPAGQGYVDRLERSLGVKILNKGVSGDTTDGAKHRLDADVLRHDPRIVLLCLGGNDFLRRLDRDIAFSNLETMIRRIQEKGALVILIGHDFPLGGSWAVKYQDLARRTGCPFVPAVLDGILGDSALMADNIHPNAAGYERFAEKVEKVLAKYLKQPEPASR
jgi:lysophospholipase L1-like esterase